MTHQAKHADGQRREIPRGSDILVDLHGAGRASDKRQTIFIGILSITLWTFCQAAFAAFLKPLAKEEALGKLSSILSCRPVMTEENNPFKDERGARGACAKGIKSSGSTFEHFPYDNICLELYCQQNLSKRISKKKEMVELMPFTVAHCGTEDLLSKNQLQRRRTCFQSISNQLQRRRTCFQLQRREEL